MRAIWKHVKIEKIADILPLFPESLVPAKNELIKRKKGRTILSYYKNGTLYVDNCTKELAVEIERKIHGEFMCYLGVDEAGKGDLVGSLFVSSFRCNEDKMGEVIETLSTSNTKKSNPLSIVNTYKRLKSIKGVEIKTVKIPPKELERNVNEVLEEAFFNLLKNSDLGECGACRVSLDNFGIKNKKRFHAIHPHCEKHIVPKADDMFFEARAASISAKANKILEMEKIAKEEGLSIWEIGTGAAADNRTREWVKEILDKNEEKWFIRKKFVRNLKKL